MRSLRPALIASLALAACAGPPASTGEMTEPIAVHLVSSPNDGLAHLVVTVAQVRALVDGEWHTVGNQAAQLDLAQLTGGAYALLGNRELPAGRLDALKLYVTDAGDNYAEDLDGTRHPLSVPSGEASGVQLDLGMDLPVCSAGSVTLDLDGAQSIAAEGDQWTLRPVIHLRGLELNDAC